MTRENARSRYVLIGTTVVWLLLFVAWLSPGQKVLPAISFTEDQHLVYTLSGFGQSLAVVLGIVFTVILVSLQLASRYSYRALAYQMPRVAVLFLACAVSAVILPFVAISWESMLLSKLALLWGSYTLVLLVPFVLWIRSGTSADSLLARCLTEALGEAREGEKWDEFDFSKQEPRALAIVDEIAQSALRAEDYAVFKAAIETRLVFHQRLATERIETLFQFGHHVPQWLVDMAKEKPMAVEMLVAAHVDVAAKAISIGEERAMRHATATVVGLGHMAWSDGATHLSYASLWGVVKTHWLHAKMKNSTESQRVLKEVAGYSGWRWSFSLPTCFGAVIDAVGAMTLDGLILGVYGDGPNWRPEELVKMADGLREHQPYLCRAGFWLTQIAGWFLTQGSDALAEWVKVTLEFWGLNLLEPREVWKMPVDDVTETFTFRAWEHVGLVSDELFEDKFEKWLRTRMSQ